MESTVVLNRKIDALPENLKREVLDFVDFLLEKERKKKSKRNRQKTQDRSRGGTVGSSPGYDNNDSIDIDESEWLRTASTNTAFDFLKDVAEDIYTLEDGKPFNPND
jgi:hypothetical protein